MTLENNPISKLSLIEPEPAPVEYNSTHSQLGPLALPRDPIPPSAAYVRNGL